MHFEVSWPKEFCWNYENAKFDYFNSIWNKTAGGGEPIKIECTDVLKVGTDCTIESFAMTENSVVHFVLKRINKF